MKYIILILALVLMPACRAHVRMVEMNYDLETGAHESGVVTYASEIDRAPALALKKAQEWCGERPLQIASEVRPLINAQSRATPVIPVGRGALIMPSGTRTVTSKLTYLSFKCK